MKKNIEIKDADIIDEDKEKEEKVEEKKEKETEPEKVINKTREKKKGSGLIYVIVCIIILLIFGAFVIALNNIGLIKFDGIEINTNEKAKLNYTDTNTKQKSVVSVTDVSDVVEEVMPSIVAITSKTLISSGYYGPFFFGGSGRESYAQGAGSGIIVSQTDDELLILTNAHVVSDADELSVQFIDEKSVDATVKGISEEKDVAVISIKLSDIDKDTLSNIKVATIGDSSRLKVGNGIIAIGNALGYGQSVTVGVVSALNRTIQGDENNQEMIQIDAAINGGNSGGALLNSSGEVVGINSAKYSNNGSYNSASIEGMGFAIPVSDVKETIEDLMNGKGSTETSSGAVIGITGDMVSGEITGFYISEVTSKNASKAGLEAGYIVTGVEGKKVTSMEVISNVLKGKKAGDKITLTVAYPNGNKYKEKDVKVTLS